MEIFVGGEVLQILRVRYPYSGDNRPAERERADDGISPWFKRGEVEQMIKRVSRDQRKGGDW
jgi:hypothetical protein